MLTFSSADSGLMVDASHWPAQEACNIMAGLHWAKH